MNRLAAPLAKFFAKFAQLPSCPCPLCQCLRQSALLKRFRGLAHVLATLLDLLSSISHALAVLVLLHALSQLVCITQDLLLLVPQAFELPFDLLNAPELSQPPPRPIAVP